MACVATVFCPCVRMNCRVEHEQLMLLSPTVIVATLLVIGERTIELLYPRSSFMSPVLTSLFWCCHFGLDTEVSVRGPEFCGLSDPNCCVVPFSLSRASDCLDLDARFLIVLSCAFPTSARRNVQGFIIRRSFEESWNFLAAKETSDVHVPSVAP